MSRWDRSDWPPSATKLPPPEHGLKMRKAGTTWWGLRWIEALERVLSGDAGRLTRGKTYARAGRTHDLSVHAGTISAKVTGTRRTPYDVVIALSQLTDEVWERAVASMAERAQFAAELLAGRMPEPIDDVFRAAGASLFPVARSELSTTCSCPDWGDPCKHVAATHYVLGEALDADPFLLFELRGRDKARVLAGIRAARAGAAPPVDGGGRRPGPVVGAEPGNAFLGAVPTVSLGSVAADEYDRPRAALPAIDFSFDRPDTHAALLRQLGAPAAWRAEASPAELLAPLVRRAADAARRIALGEVAPEADERPAPTPRARKKKRSTQKSGASRSRRGDRAAPPRRASKKRAAP
jgi:uncharacterized Zn finger protein